MSLIQQFFKPVKDMIPCSEDDYRQLNQEYKSFLTMMSETDHKSFYMIDYNRKSFDYVSPNPLFYADTRQKKSKTGDSAISKR